MYIYHLYEMIRIHVINYFIYEVDLELLNFLYLIKFIYYITILYTFIN